MRQRNRCAFGLVDSYQRRALPWCSCPATTSASQTFKSGKRNDVVDTGIVDSDQTGSLEWNDRKLQSLTLGLSGAFIKRLLEPAKNEFLRGTTLASRPRLQLTVNRIGDVNRRSHDTILPYLWLDTDAHFRLRSPAPMWACRR